MYFRLTDGAIGESNRCEAFALSPAAPAVTPDQPRELADATSTGDGPNVAQRTNDLEALQMGAPPRAAGARREEPNVCYDRAAEGSLNCKADLCTATPIAGKREEGT